MVLLYVHKYRETHTHFSKKCHIGSEHMLFPGTFWPTDLCSQAHKNIKDLCMKYTYMRL